jgi:microcin C transport system substrate-binding protein
MVLAARALTTLGMPGAISFAAAQAAAPRDWRHGLSLFGDLKYKADFKQFDYVNANAPKGGAARMVAIGTYDSFNLVVAGLKGQIAAGIELIYDSLMVPALDEVSTEYGLLADAASFPDDFSSVTYRLRGNAKWHDGQPVTADDVVFSFETFKNNSPFSAAYYQHVVKAEKTGEREITFRFDGPGTRELQQIVGQPTVLP